MTSILAIDPGNLESAYALIDTADRRPVQFGKVSNAELLADLRGGRAPQLVFADVDLVAIEMVASYGMPVGREVFDTCVWVGRFLETVSRWSPATEVRLVFRQPVKLHHCGSSKAKDSNIVQALVDRFAPGQPNKGKGTKAAPGWFYGFAKDVWQAYALGVYVADTAAVRAEPVPTW